jgi:hypothetical protein
MTCIVGLVADGIVYMGGDRAAVTDHYVHVGGDPKIFAYGDYVMGYTTSFRMGQIGQYHFKPPPPRSHAHSAAVVMCHMVQDFVPALRAVMKDHGFLETKDGVEKAGTWLVGVRGQLFKIQDDFSVMRSESGYQAVGSGAVNAIASLWQSDDERSGKYHFLPQRRVEMALEAAAEHVGSVRGPFDYFQTTLGDF